MIIPLFKHSVLLSEAVQSVIDQACPFEVVTVIVDDGCPFLETATVGLSLAAANPMVRYLRKPNGGLSSARNFGIEYLSWFAHESVAPIIRRERPVGNRVATVPAALCDRSTE